jgi:hypothetical protein
MAWLKKHLPKLLRKQAQTTEATREIEALKLRLRQDIDKLGKVYSDIVEFEKRYTPEQGLTMLAEKTGEFLKGVNEVLEGVRGDAQVHINDVVQAYKDKFGVS